MFRTAARASAAAITAAAAGVTGACGVMEAKQKDQDGASEKQKTIEYAIFFSAAVQSKLMNLFPANFPNIYYNHMPINVELSDEDRDVVEQKLGTVYKVCWQYICA